ncbi:GNAT family N-acetyltransferase [Paenibacillus sp. KN14-4R]|uniref:GNAT family N-acetyltransferase n=1 Tax=Paenibacillus sp. KN14-4R TaxID=3445773 RepID=UPI003F9FC815
MNKHLFLIGGGPPFTPKLAGTFAELTSRRNAPVVVLIVWREGWEDYQSRYTEQLEKYGVEQFKFLPLPITPIDKVIHHVKQCSGIIIGGGDTNLYADYIVDTPIGGAIKAAYEQGIPVAGFSAGALISPAQCVISAKDNDKEQFQLRKGIGLVEDMVLAVHFSQWEDESHLRLAVQTCQSKANYGIDECSCVYLLNGQLESTEAMEGYGVYTIANDGLEDGLKATGKLQRLGITIEEIIIFDPKQDTKLLDDLSELLVQVVDNGASIGFLPPLARDEARTYWQNMMQAGVKLWIAKNECDHIVGTIQLHLALKKNAPHRAEVAKLMVHPSHRRKGIAQQLLDTMEHKAKEEKRSLLILDTREGDPSNKLYQSNGFVEVGRIPEYVISDNGEYQATVYYYKKL